MILDETRFSSCWLCFLFRGLHSLWPGRPIPATGPQEKDFEASRELRLDTSQADTDLAYFNEAAEKPLDGSSECGRKCIY